MEPLIQELSQGRFESVALDDFKPTTHPLKGNPPDCRTLNGRPARRAYGELVETFEGKFIIQVFGDCGDVDFLGEFDCRGKLPDELEIHELAAKCDGGITIVFLSRNEDLLVLFEWDHYGRFARSILRCRP